MKKLTAFLLCVFLLSAFSVTAFADDIAPAPPDTRKAVVSTVVPDDHTITFKVYGNVEFKLNGEKGDTFKVPRLSEPVLELFPAENQKITSITVNGEDHMDKFTDLKYTFPPIYEDKELIVQVETEEIPQPDPNPNPKTGIVGGISIGALLLLAAFGVVGRKRTNN